MRRLLLIPVALLGIASAVALASTHQANLTASGKISSLTLTAITVGHGEHHRACAITADSPATTAFSIGDRVKIACSNHVLVAIADAPATTNRSANEQPATTGISGTVTAATPTAITVHDGDRDVTCTVSGASPSVTAVNVGDHVRIGCANGVLVSLDTTPTSTTTTSANVTSANGPITALGLTSITVQTMPCTIGPNSPSTAGFKVGDSVRMYCLNGALYVLKHNDDGPPPTTTDMTTTPQTYAAITGTITTLGSSITVQSDGAPLTCTLGTGTPSTAGFAVGNPVRMYCLNGALYQLRHNEPSTTTTTTTTTATTTTTPQTYAAISGTITTLGSSITVQGDGAPLTCTLGTGTPSTAGFAVGNPVRMYCLNGALYVLRHNDPPTTTTTTTTTNATTTTTPETYAAVSGTISALGSSITVQSDGAALTCTLGTGTPSTAGFAVGDPVRMYCLNGALYQLRHNDLPTTTSTTTTTTTTATTTTTTPVVTSYGTGTITALSADQITVTGDAALSCSIGAGSPSVTAYHVGESVKLYCRSGALYALTAA